MEASVAGQGQGQGDAGEAAGQGQQQDGQQQGQDLSALQEQLAAVAGGTDEVRQLLMAMQEGDDSDDAEVVPDLSWLDVDSPEFDPQVVAQRLTDTIDQAAEQKIQPVMQRLDAFEKQQQENARVEEASRLVEEFPELGDTNIAQQVVTTSRQLAEAQFPPHMAAELAQSPAWWRVIYMAGRAADASNAEDGQGSQAALLESGQGARPGSAATADELGDSIVSGRRGRSVLPFG